ncbi:hypothetical protein PR202_ga29166 [Eleusine coracana subsp. coracana]|uniref:Uncharacterized protein n=1 Tax=Eleusine coracana subsp. coracana TaxID=191504 RepID=A0AAV5DJ93_ELECO|nr:hypothetical protein PR202_ga29166 [Eleusine coracana subsp. coracana]
MTVGFRQTLSTLESPKSVAPSFLLDCVQPKNMSYAQVRSTSLPARLHPRAAVVGRFPAQTSSTWVADWAA